MTAVRQKQTSAHPDDAMLVYDNVETAIAEKLAREGLTNLLLSKKEMTTQVFPARLRKCKVVIHGLLLLYYRL